MRCGRGELRDDLVGQRVALANQLRGLLDEFWPGAAVIFADVDSPIALDFLDHYPTPQAAASLGEKRMAAFMARHAYSGRRSARELLERLRAAPCRRHRWAHNFASLREAADRLVAIAREPSLRKAALLTRLPLEIGEEIKLTAVLGDAQHTLSGKRSARRS